MFSQSKWMIAATLYCGVSASVMIPSHAAIAEPLSKARYKHVLILSVDGLHGADVADPVLQSDLPNIRSLEQTGVTYTNAFTTQPSDSFPGTLAYVTGATPRTTGVYYDNAYDRLLTAPGSGTPSSAGSPTEGNTTTAVGDAPYSLGTQVLFDESIDKNPDLLSGGGDYGVGSIDVTKLPLDCTSGTCTPFYPHQYPRVNTIFDVAKAAGLYTAYSDKHSGAYDIVNGPSGNAVDDYFSPEIAAIVSIQDGQLVDDPNGKGVTSDYRLTEAYDDLKVNVILNQIKGLNSLGTTSPGVPAIFGMNFQAVSVAQKAQVGGIDVDSNGNEIPSKVLTDALSHTDQSIGQIVKALQQNKLFDSTLVVVTAKHGQNPRLGSATLVKDSIIPDALKAAGVNIAQATQDDVSLLWLKDQSQVNEANQVLEALRAETQICGGSIQQNCNPGIDQIFYGAGLVRAGFGNPYRNSRTPDLVVKLKPGYILVGNVASSVKRAEHGGLNDDDTHVALIVGSSGLPTNLQGTTQTKKVATKQVAVTTLGALGLNTYELQGADIEHTQPLPGLGLKLIGD